MKKYEALFILDPRKVDDEGRALAQEITQFITSKNGQVSKTDFMGRKQFAREINKRKAGFYLDLQFEISPEEIIEIRNQYRLDERVLRMLIIIDERPEGYTNVTINI